MEDTNFEIFTQISDFVTKDEFSEAQNLFFEKHKADFDDSEENKLEHM